MKIAFVGCLVPTSMHPMEDNPKVVVPSLKDMTFAQTVFNLGSIVSSSNAANLNDHYSVLKNSIARMPQDVASDVERSICREHGWSLYPWKKVIIRAYSQPAASVTGLGFSSDGRFLASGAGGHGVFVWDLIRLNSIKKLMVTAAVRKLAFLPNDNTLAILHDQNSLDAHIDFYSIFTGNKFKSVPVPDEYDFLSHYDSISFSQNGESMAKGEKRDVILSTCKERSIDILRKLFLLWDHHVCGKENLHQCDQLPHQMIPVPFGTSLKAASTWYIANADLQTVLKGHDDDVIATAYDNDARYLASTAHDKTLRIWDVKKSLQLVVAPFASIVRTIMFSADGTSLACGCDDGIIHVCSLYDTLLHMVCKAALHNELKRGDRQYLMLLYNHPLINKCDVVLREYLRSMVAMKLIKLKDV